MKILKGFIAVGFCILSLHVLTASVSAEQWEEFNFNDLGFSIQCPANWSVSKLSQEMLKDMVAIVLPKNTTRKGFRANMVIISSTSGQPSMPLENFYKLNLDNMSSSQDFPGFKLESSYNIKLGKYDAYQATFTYRHPKLDVKLKSFQIYTMNDKGIFIIQYAAPTGTYKKYMDEVNEVVRTFIPLQ